MPEIVGARGESLAHLALVGPASTCCVALSRHARFMATVLSPDGQREQTIFAEYKSDHASALLRARLGFSLL